MKDILDENIIGYDLEKNLVRQISHVLKNSKTYIDRGASLPHGLLITGEPGTGKSTLCEALIEDSGRKCFILKKSEDSEFLTQITEAFSKAKEAHSSIVFLDDLDKFSETKSKFASEWASLQTAIDSIKNDDVFVIDTTNSLDYVADSLLRPGRFDYHLELEIPRGKTAEAIMAHYLKKVSLGNDLSISDIAAAMDSKSCSTLETVSNVALINSIYEGCNKIYKRHFVDALLQIVFKTGKETLSQKELDKVAWHEAAHLLVAEIRCPETTSLCTIRGKLDKSGGITCCTASEVTRKKDFMDLICISLAGKVGTEIVYSELDVGASEDLQKAMNIAYDYITVLGGSGLSNVESEDHSTSDTYKQHTETLAAALMDQLYYETKKIILENMQLYEKIQDSLLKNETLLKSDIRRIMEEK